MDIYEKKAYMYLTGIEKELMHAMNNVSTASRAHDILTDIAVTVQQSKLDLIKGK